MLELVALYGMSCGSTVIDLIGQIAIYFDINSFKDIIDDESSFCGTT
jgi:hypothetical protein